MILKIGTDIVFLPRFEKIFRENKEHFLQNVFCKEELESANVQRLAGIFASKEATIKALGIKVGRWQEICVAHKESGKPYLATFPQETKARATWKHDLTIAHDGDYAIAHVIFYQ